MQKKAQDTSGFALIVTLILMALIVTVVVAYLANTRSDRATSSSYANRLRAKMIADSGLASATKLLYENTKTGNYITAMPSPSPTPTSIRTEIYRPDTTGGTTDDFLKLNNAIGEVMVSRADTAALSAPTPPVDPRPVATLMPAPVVGGSFGIADPNLTTATSYDFNQVVRVGSTDTGRLVNAATPIQPAFGQWIRVRNSAGELIGRYAFFIEDESMKTNVNTAGNNLGASSANLRVNDLIVPAPASTPTAQAQEIDPAGSLPVAAARANATKALVGIAAAGNRISTKNTVGVLTDWDNGTTKLSDYAHTLTANSSDDVTTARGWQRMDLNKIVADATGGNAAKAAAAQKIADWIKDCWTGPVALGAMQTYQVYGDERLRRQLGANIVDYIDADNIPTDMGQYPEGDTNAPAVIGIEKIPYLVEVDVVYKATAMTPPAPNRATIAMSFRLNFFNMYDADLRLSDFVGKITIKGVPVIDKNGAKIFDHETQTFEVTVGGANGIPDAVVPAGGDNSASGAAGAKTFRTSSILSEDVTYTPGNQYSAFESGLLEVEVVGKNGERLDSCRISLRDQAAKYQNAGASLSNDFLEQKQSAASINDSWEGVVGPGGTITPIKYGDACYRPSVVTHRFYNQTRTDITRFTTTSEDTAQVDSRAYAVDWHDYIGNRPLYFHRNGPLQSVGELGNVGNCEYPWRTVYLQYAGRPESTLDTNVIPQVQARRGSAAAAQTNPSLLPQDYVLMDLFTTSQEKTRSGSININSQYNLKNATGEIEQGAIPALMSAIPIGPMKDGVGANLGGSTFSAAAVKILSKSIAERRIAFAPLPNGGPGTSGAPPIDNNPRRPYFTTGEIASVISRLINQNSMTPATTKGNTRDRSTTVYSVLRANPTTTSDWKRDYCDDQQVEEPFRKISSATTTRGNVFRVLYVGQAIKDQKSPSGQLGDVESTSEVMAEYLGEAYVERQAIFGTPTNVGTSSVTKTTDSKFRTLAQRAVTE